MKVLYHCYARNTTRILPFHSLSAKGPLVSSGVNRFFRNLRLNKVIFTGADDRDFVPVSVDERKHAHHPSFRRT